jgi:voltage-gated potassium channel
VASIRTKTSSEAAQEQHDRHTKSLVILSFVWLIIFSAILPHHGALTLERFEEQFASTTFHVQLSTLFALWILFLVDYIVLLVALRGSLIFLKKAGQGLLVVIFPIYRLSISTFEHPKVWIPFLGWQPKDRTLEKRLARFFSLPMIFVALMVLPILAIEYFHKAWIERYDAVKVFLSLGSQIIWLAFTIEFTLMISVTRRKMAYCRRHWIDIAIILLPVILFILPFLSFLPILRLGRLIPVIRSTRLFRLKGVGLKAFQALVLFSGTQRFGKSYHERKLRRLKRRLLEMEEDMEELREEIAELEEAQRKAEKKADEEYDSLEPGS